jgi:ABC-type phosphate/phosphonate transport system permease subunit
MASRTPEEIRASIEHNRQELGTALEKVRAEVIVLTDWRSQLRRNQEQLTRGAAVAGFVLGGGIAGLTGLAFGRGKRKKRR